MTSKQLYSKERYIGRKAASMAEEYVKRQIKLELTIRNKGDALNNIKPLMEATKVRAKMGKWRLLGLNFTSSKVGFIHQFGFTGVRGGSVVMLKASRYNETATTRESHDFKIDRTGMFNNIYERSGASEYLIEKLGEIRTDAVKIKIAGLILQINEEDGK